eukprot:Gb_37457 [translate_table: standard]
MAGQYLVDLPSRGFFGSSVFPSSNPDGLRVYVCDHDTAPPEDQVIKTDSTNILIRSLTLKKAKADAKPRDNKRKTLVENGKGKRPAEKPLDDKLTVKRANSSGITVSSKKEGSSSRLPDRELQNCTVDKLRALLKERGLPTKGKKDELIARLKQ